MARTKKETMPELELKEEPVQVETIEKDIVKKEEKKYKKSKPKIADRPHTIAIILSGLALLISCISWWESRSARLISLSSNRAVAYVTELQRIKEKIDTPAPRYKIIIKNLGRSNATPVLSSYQPFVSAVEPTTKDYPTVVFEKLWEDIPPGFQKEREVPLNWGMLGDKTPVPKKNESIYLIGVLNYADESSGEWHRQRWCFKLDKEMNPQICYNDY